MTRKLITRISNELGNQLFMYASTFAIAKKLDRKLLIDNETSFKSKKNISKYGLDNFTISSDIADKNDKFLGIMGYMKRKLLKKLDYFLNNKNFYVEAKDKNKITKYDEDIFHIKLSNKAFFEGYFESEKYFIDIKDQILNEFEFINANQYKKTPYFEKISQNNTVSICLRQNRFIEGKGNNNTQNKEKSNIFRDEQINYINKSINYLKGKIDNPTFYLWSNDLDNIDMSMFNSQIIKIHHNPEAILGVDKRSLDLFLISQCSHHIVIPSSFNWWGAWLCKKNNKIICRPAENLFSTFKINNLDFWPNDWIKIS